MESALYGKEDHVWMSIERFENYQASDCFVVIAMEEYALQIRDGRRRERALKVKKQIAGQLIGKALQWGYRAFVTQKVATNIMNGDICMHKVKTAFAKSIFELRYCPIPPPTSNK